MVDSSMLDPDSITVEEGHEVIQLDGGYATPTNEATFSSLFFSQVDGAGDEDGAELIKSEPQQDQERVQSQGSESDEATLLIYKDEVSVPSEQVTDEPEPMETSGTSETDPHETEG